jgi:hypothetical protein
MDFATVFLEKNDKNVAVILLEKGLIKASLTKSMDNASKYLEDLLAAEKKASESKQEMYSQHPAPIKVFNDLVQDPKKAKQFEAMVMKRPSRKMNGVAEYCFSGMRFKVRLDGESTSIDINLLGVKPEVYRDTMEVLSPKQEGFINNGMVSLINGSRWFLIVKDICILL